MTEAEIKQLADTAAHEAVKRTLLALGIDASDPEAIIAMQADFRHLRTWRESTEAVRRKAFLTAVAVIVTGALGYLWVAFKGQP